MALYEKLTVKEFAIGIVTVGTSAVQITPIPVSEGGKRGILLKTPGPNSDNPNSNDVFIGRANVTADQTGSGGFPLAPGESVVLPIELADSLYAISTVGGQIINWVNL